MPFAYYQRLKPAQRRIYDQSARIASVPLRSAAALRERSQAIEAALRSEKRALVQRACAALVDGLCADLAVASPLVKVLTRRPKDHVEELHGLYTREEGARPLITIWMRTAELRKVVAYRAFVRTLLHEVLHHLDYEHFGLADSFHTEGFYQRESSLAHQLLAPPPPPPRAEPSPAAEPPPGPSQLALPFAK